MGTLKAMAIHKQLPKGFQFMDVIKADLEKGTVIVSGIWPGNKRPGEYQVQMKLKTEKEQA
ncbi:MAG TPA: hypothetical protein VIR02_00530 [Anaerolineales bacterium]